ncbi:MAG TPA: hypothetical protein VJX23_09155 [Candidatus Binataceae bacterium]|nr:hypothetical protein [Candidatus Binataceae bacterium]
MNRMMTLISDTVGPAEMLAIGLELKQKGLVQEARVAVAGLELILTGTNDFTRPEYEAYVGMVKYFLDWWGIKTIEDIEDQV